MIINDELPSYVNGKIFVENRTENLFKARIDQPSLFKSLNGHLLGCTLERGMYDEIRHGGLTCH